MATKLTVDSIQITTSFKGEKIIMLFSDDHEHGTKLVFWPQEIQDEIRNLAHVLAEYEAYGKVSNDQEYQRAKAFERKLKDMLTSQLSLGNLTLSDAQEVLQTLDFPSEDFQL